MGEYLCDRIPLKRPGQPQDLDAAVVFLAAESSRYVTGQTLLVDGGISTGATRALVSPRPDKPPNQVERSTHFEWEGCTREDFLKSPTRTSPI